ncbi:MAG: PQQ-like beta-propeller repeat protein [Nanoarchaeota archaeon]|nr:PQQ-like beta-propeller repeat protein [Nanoarchaeota archaeon]
MFSHKKKGLAKEWSLDVQTDITSQCSFVEKGIVFGTQSGKIVCVNFQGQIQWSFETNPHLGKEESLFLDQENSSSIVCTPLVHADFIYVGTELGEIYCLSADGSQIWKQKVESAIRGTPSIIPQEGGEPAIAVGTIDGVVHFLDLKGKKMKAIKIHTPITSNILYVDGKIFVGCEDGKVIAFNTKGLHLWTYQTKGQITADLTSCELFGDGEKILLIASHDNYLYALTLDGELKWKFETKGSLISAPITAHLSSDQGKDILLGSCDNNVYCISPQGEKIWSYETDFWVTAPPVLIDKDGFFRIVAGSYDQKMYVLDGQGDFNLSFMPGLSGIINQTGYSSLMTSRDVGEDTAKKLAEEETQGHITSCRKIPDSEKILVTTKQGIVYEFELR